MERLHSDRGYLYVAVFLVGLAVLHLSVNELSGRVPATLSFVSSVASGNGSSTSGDPLDDVYVKGGGNLLPYLVRNLSLKYAVYPLLVLTFLADHYGLKRLFRWFDWRIFSLLLVSGLGAVMVAGGAHLAGVDRFPYYLLYQVEFQDTSAAFYVYGVATWLVTLIGSYCLLSRRFPRYVAFWLTCLIFLSLEMVWEYPTYMRGLAPLGYVMATNPPPLYVYTLHLWRLAPTFLLLYYVWRWGLVRWNRAVNVFLVAAAVSALTIIFNPIDRGVSNWLGLSLRVFWAAAYLVAAYYLWPNNAVRPPLLTGQSIGTVALAVLICGAVAAALVMRSAILKSDSLFDAGAAPVYLLVLGFGIFGALSYRK